jgi:threonine/homoserine/homoserine lactone efflux protein
MLLVLADLLTIAVAIAISPLAIVAVILMATAGKGRSNGTAFVLGCYVFMIVFVGALVALGRAVGADESRSAPRFLVDGVEILLGVALLVMAVRQWRRRGSTHTPAWMDRLDGLTIGQAFLVGVLLAGPLSPKDLPLLIAAGGRISQTELPVEEIVAVILIFAAIGLTAVAIPWIVSVVAPDKAVATLSAPRAWLVQNHAVIVTVLFVILGFKLVGSGVADLVG